MKNWALYKQLFVVLYHLVAKESDYSGRMARVKLVVLVYDIYMYINILFYT